MRRVARLFLSLLVVPACNPPPVPAPAVATPTPPPAVAPDAPPPGPPPPSVETIREHTRALSADDMDGRRPGTPGAARAVAYIIDQMKAIGLRPGGVDGSWTQTVPMRSVVTDPARVALATVVDGAARPLAFGTDIVISTFRAAGTHRVDAELVFVGYGVTAPEYGWDDYDGVDLSGKIAVVLVGDPPLGADRFAGDALTYYGRWSYKFEQAERAGARGVLIVHETEPASYGWNVIHTSWTHARTHVPQAQAGDPVGLVGWLSRDTAAALASACGTSLEAWHQQAIDPAFVPAPLGASLRGEFVTSESRTQDVNVLGRLDGTRWPQQTVAMTAHWDHLGHGAETTPGVDAIYNGAVDNASGVAGMLAVAAQLQVRVAAGRPLGRSVLFIATTGEEEGLLGSTYFADHPSVPLAELVGVVNLDSMNVHGRTRTIQVIGPGHTTIEDLLREVADAEGRAVVPDEHPGSGGYYRSDHFSFARRGVPAIYVRGGTEMEDGGTEAGRRIGEARSAHYHTVDDEFDASWSFEGTLQDVHTVASLVARIADGESVPQWKPTSEFAGVPR